jgi:hypothetical protein
MTNTDIIIRALERNNLNATALRAIRLSDNAESLLVALIWAIDQLEDDLDPDQQQAMAAARAAIARATGASSQPG